jgi:ATP-dependent helicase/nuclease subunit B
MSAAPKVFTIASSSRFLDVLSDEVIAGFPLPADALTAFPDLSAWTILVPNRRSARELERCFSAKLAAAGRALPRIHPIGDLDPDDPELPGARPDLPRALSAIGRDLAVISLVHQWADENPHLQLARSLSAAPLQAQALASSLTDLVDNLEVEEISLDRLPEAYGIDLAIHREAILGLLGLIRVRLPRLLAEEGLIGGRERRSRVIRLFAQQLRMSRHQAPIIAAGTTGSIPATRELLAAIVQAPNGRVVLPGLDLGMDEACWQAASPQHPQYLLKTLLETLEIPRADVGLMGPAPKARSWLASELMRPTATADQWAAALKSDGGKLAAAAEGLTIIAVRDRREEAQAIAVAVRDMLSQQAAPIAIVTPDPALARRIRSALSRFNVAVDVTSGESLAARSAVLPLSLLLDAITHGFTARALAGLLHGPFVSFGLAPDSFRKGAADLEIAALRSQLPLTAIANLRGALAFILSEDAKTLQRHARMSGLDAEARDLVLDLAGAMADALSPLDSAEPRALQDNMALIMAALEAMCGHDARQAMAEAGLDEVVDALLAEGRRLPQSTIAEAASLLRHFIVRARHYVEPDQAAQVAIMGTLEARLVRPDTVILAGLNEGSWPRQPESGPWLNRPMRTVLAAQQPEVQIGQMAHDLTQNLGANRVVLTHAMRDGGEPLAPSRWITRLEAILKENGVSASKGEAWLAEARSLDAPPAIKPHAMPAPTPPLAARPPRLSVTQVDILISDPYALYARKVLQLEPLEAVGAQPSAALRGSIYHAVLARFFQAHPRRPPTGTADAIIAIGRRHFAPLLADSAVAGFWWPRLRRVAQWVEDNAAMFYDDIEGLHAEATGSIEVPDTSSFTLTARADLIVERAGASAAIYDFKTGKPPNAKEDSPEFSAQLTLEAAMLARGGFKGLGRRMAEDIAYIQITGGVPAAEVKLLSKVVPETWEAHLAGLAALVTAYRNEAQPYLPRARGGNDERMKAFDHLSRHREWMLAEEPR